MKKIMFAALALVVPIFQKVLPGKKAVTIFQLDRHISIMVDAQLTSQLPLVQSQDWGRQDFLMRTQQDERTPELNISVIQVLLAMAVGLCSAGPLVWIFVRYWLFAP